MNMMNPKYRLPLFGVTVLLLFVVVAAFYWNEARKEVVFLCGNFSSGVSRANVQRQLDTGNLLRYRAEEFPGGQRIIVDSGLNVGVYRCVVEFDGNNRVLRATIR